MNSSEKPKSRYRTLMEEMALGKSLQSASATAGLDPSQAYVVTKSELFQSELRTLSLAGGK